MSDNVIPLRGERLPGEPYADLVVCLEGLLERARRGEIIAIGYATVSPDDVFGTGWDGAGGTRNGLGMAIAALGVRYPMAIIETSSEKIA